ncbi:hypothetical protein [Nocardia wallacei]|uniref:Uncharacterized protein n=1 Tax=Nocardia wallacei TaxID=480035 RepID=A0A7G1KM64_9NOCA|nr:hypothetical protein [Nocardia wallacei]BCK55313.1 hypothetical protein NWFMUON74_30850 [Nocardia wallacei]
MSTFRAAATVTLAGIAVWSAMSAGAAAAPVLVSTDPVSMRVAAPGGHAAAPVASGSAERFQKPDPGPYPNMEECERARARYYDPSQLECVPVR